MPARPRRPDPIAAWIATQPPAARPVLRTLRATIRRAAPQAEEVISYRMPAVRAHGILVYYAVFKSHVGLFPPIRGDAAIMQAIAPYAGPKGNLRFPLDRPLPLRLIARLVRLRVRQDAEQAARPRSRAKKTASR